MITESFIFVHIPKTAGRSIITALGGKINNQHKTISDYCKELTESVVRSRFKFTCVRNPWDRALSWWSFFGNMGFERVPFEQWLKKMNSRPRNPNQKFPLDQMSFCKSPFGEVLMDHFIRFENLDEDFALVANRLNVPPILPAIGKQYRQHQKQLAEAIIRSKHPEHAPLIAPDDYHDAYTIQESIDAVARMDAETIARFGYDFKR